MARWNASDIAAIHAWKNTAGRRNFGDGTRRRETLAERSKRGSIPGRSTTDRQANAEGLEAAADGGERESFIAI